MKAKYPLLKLFGSLFALALLAAPSLDTAALTISHVRVVVGGQEYCDTTVAGCTNIIWNLGGGVTLTPGQTLILTQTGTISGPVLAGNFDTTDRGNLGGFTCSNAGGTACTVQIYIDSGSGLVKVVDDNGNSDPLTAKNAEPGSLPTDAFDEAAIWQTAFTGSTYKLDLGYADNVHSNPCTGGAPGTSGCFPQDNWCTFPGGTPTTSCPAAATYFVGAGLPAPFADCGPSLPHTDQDNTGNHVGCYDSGALRITALAVPHLNVLKTPKSFTFASGSQLTYNVVVSNNGDAGSVAHNVKLDDQLPSNGGLVWQTATASNGGTCTISATNLLHCDLGDIAAGAGNAVTVTIKSTATTPATACQDQPNPAAIATDNEGDRAQDSGDQSCAQPHLKVVKTPKSFTFTSGSQLTYTVVVSNDGAAGSVAHSVMLDDVLPGFGGLVWQTATATQGSCTIVSNVLHCALLDIAQGSSVTVTIQSTATTPAAACQDQPNPAANATDNEGDKATDSGDQTCKPAGGLIAPTSTSCQDFASGTASALGQINYPVSGGKIGQGINPGVFFYYTKITTTVANQVVTVSESQNDAAALFQIHQGQAYLYTANCSSSTKGTLISGDTGASFTVATPGTYIIGIKYNTKSIVGTSAPTSDPVTYTFTTSLGASTSATVLLKKE